MAAHVCNANTGKGVRGRQILGVYWLAILMTVVGSVRDRLKRQGEHHYLVYIYMYTHTYIQTHTYILLLLKNFDFIV